MRQSYYDSSNSEIEKLKRELADAREAVIEMTPDKVRTVLHGYLRCESRADANRWSGTAVDTLIDAAEVIPGSGVFSDRANCPLCGYGGQGPYVDGFTVPEGLRRHLTGWGRVSQCTVMATVMKLAREHWNRKFHEVELEEEKVKHVKLAARLNSETLYKVSPFGEPVLASSDSLSEARNEADLAWAEERLKSLGFKVMNEGRVRTYLDEHADYVVYADPRMKGDIKFTVHKLPFKKRSRRTNLIFGGYFRLADSWKNELPQKYAKRLEEALKSLKA